MEIARLTFTRREADDDLDRQRQSGGRTSHDSLSFVNGVVTVVWMRRIGEILFIQGQAAYAKKGANLPTLLD